MRSVVCPGSFDPATNGHLDIIGRAARLYDEVVVAVLVNPSKAGLFSIDERLAMLREVTARYPNVRVTSFQGLLVDFCKANDIRVVVKGIRAVSDFDYELQMAQMNLGLAGVETLFMATNPLYSFLSSSLIKDVAKWGGDVAHHVPKLIAARLQEKLTQAPVDEPSAPPDHPSAPPDQPSASPEPPPEPLSAPPNTASRPGWGP
jgi:pantetheine-phosphate adenylyltransferase